MRSGALFASSLRFGELGISEDIFMATVTDTKPYITFTTFKHVYRRYDRTEII
jgi:hypothetical protein